MKKNKGSQTSVLQGQGYDLFGVVQLAELCVEFGQVESKQVLVSRFQGRLIVRDCLVVVMGFYQGLTDFLGQSGVLVVLDPRSFVDLNCFFRL